MTASRAIVIFRRPCGPYPHLIPAEKLKPAIERHLEASPRVLHVLARLLGYSESAVRVRLLELEQGQRAHRVAVPAPRAGGRHWEWRAGPAPLPDVDSEVGAAEVPQQICARQYPPIDRRDHLVAALFGPAKPLQGAA